MANANTQIDPMHAEEIGHIRDDVVTRLGVAQLVATERLRHKDFPVLGGA